MIHKMKNLNNTTARKAMKAAWTNWKAGRYTSWSECLKSAWNWVKSLPVERMINLFDCTILKSTEKAMFLNIEKPYGVGRIEKWIPKSIITVINGESCFPSWILNR